MQRCRPRSAPESWRGCSPRGCHRRQAAPVAQGRASREAGGLRLAAGSASASAGTGSSAAARDTELPAAAETRERGDMASPSSYPRAGCRVLQTDIHRATCANGRSAKMSDSADIDGAVQEYGVEPDEPGRGAGWAQQVAGGVGALRGGSGGEGQRLSNRGGRRCGSLQSPAPRSGIFGFDSKADLTRRESNMKKSDEASSLLADPGGSAGSAPAWISERRRVRRPRNCIRGQLGLARSRPLASEGGGRACH
jgi:hypothetical protein